MNLTSIPPFAAVPFANGAGAGYRNTIPATTSTPGAASMAVGFPPECFEPIASGGIPPGGADFNGILYAMSVALRWEQAGGNYPFDATFAAAIGGYPKDAIVMRSDGKGQWLNTTDGNSTDPDSASSVGWIELRANTGATTITAVAGNNTPTPNQLGAQALLVTGTLASNATLTLPLRAGAQWLVVNNTTGAGTLTVQGATGAGVSIAQGVGQLVYTDGVGYFSTSASVAGQYLPINGTAVAATKLATARAFSIGGSGSVITATAVNFDGTGNVTLNAAMADGALSIAKTSGLQTALDGKYSVNGGTINGNVTITGTATVNQSLVSSTSALVFGTNGAGSIYLRPNGAGSVTGQLSLDSNGLVSATQFAAAGGLSLQGNVSGLGGNDYLINFYPNRWLTYNKVSDRFGFGNAGLDIGGSVTAAGGFQVSDRRFKHNIERRAINSSLPEKLSPLWSQWNRNSDDGFDTGLIAQDVLAIAPQFVQVPADPEQMLAIDKSGLALECALAVEVRLQQLLARLEALENKA